MARVGIPSTVTVGVRARVGERSADVGAVRGARRAQSTLHFLSGRLFLSRFLHLCGELFLAGLGETSGLIVLALTLERVLGAMATMSCWRNVSGNLIGSL